MNKSIIAAIVLIASLAACGGGAAGGGALPTSAGSSSRGPSQNGGSTSTSSPLSACSAITLPTSSGSTTQSCVVSETGYTGALTITDGGSCTGIVAFAPATFNGPSGSFVATQIGPGTCALTAADANGQKATISVSSTTSSTVIIIPGSLETCATLSLPVDGSQSASCFVSEAGYTGMFTIDASACAGIVTVSPTSVTGPNAYVTATQVGGGSCTVKITDSKGNTGTIQIGSTWATATVSYLDALYTEVLIA